MGLVYVKRNDIFTDSIVIAKETENAHESVVKLVRTYEEQFKQLGKVEFSDYLKSDKLRSTGKLILLNEMQAIFLITLLRNTERVLKFKLTLVQEFYHMRQILMERRTTDWLQTRQKGKLIRRDETDAIQLLIPYAEEQGCKNSNMFYINYSKLVNKVVGLEAGQRETASHKVLMLVALMEDIISNTVIEEMEKGVYYKNIYQICKAKIKNFASLAYIQAS